MKPIEVYIKMPTVPNNLEQAMLSPEWPMWKLAIEDEIHGMFEQRHALDPISIDNLLPEELRRVCKLTWVFTLKLKHVLLLRDTGIPRHAP